jgi:hypothetical protein
MLLVLFSRGRGVESRTPLAGSLSAVVSPAAKRATQIVTPRVTGMRQKPNPAVHAMHRAVPQLGVGLQNRVQSRLILTNKRVGAIILVPIRSKRENLLDGYDKKARLSVKIWIALHTPSSYLLDAKTSRGRTRIFFDSTQRATTESLPMIRNPQAALLTHSTRTC